MYKGLIYFACLVFLISLYGCPRGNKRQVDIDKLTTIQNDSNGNLIMKAERSESTGRGVIKFYYPDGTLKKIQEVINDSIEYGTYKYYYPSGVLKDSAQLTGGKFHGNRFTYYENGVVYEETKYINNKVRDEIRYDSAGCLKEYWAANYGETLNFVVHYEKDKYIRTEGFLINSFVLEESYPLDKSFSIELLVGKPPRFETTVWVGYRNENESEFKELKLCRPGRFNQVVYSIDQNSEQHIEIINVAKTVYRETVISDTLFIEIDKYGKSSYHRR